MSLKYAQLWELFYSDGYIEMGGESIRKINFAKKTSIRPIRILRTILVQSWDVDWTLEGHSVF